MRAILIVGVLIGLTQRNTDVRDARILRWLLAAEQRGARGHAVQFALLDDSTSDASSPLTRQLRASGFPMRLRMSPPAGVTAFVRITRPTSDSAHYFRVGAERFRCIDGAFVGGRTMISLRCDAKTCTFMQEVPMNDGGVSLGPCALR